MKENDQINFDVNEVMKAIPHRYPFLLVDRVIEIVPNEKIVAIKNVTINEPHFQGHFPAEPIMPGVLIVEALAQAGAILLLSAEGRKKGEIVFLAGIEKARFRQPVVPGDQLRLEAEVTKVKGPVAKMQGKAYVNGKVVAEASLTASAANKE